MERGCEFVLRGLRGRQRRHRSGEVLSESIECELCEAHYLAHDGRGACSKCKPGLVFPHDSLTNPNFWPGHKFIWSESRGPLGRWVLLEDNYTVKRSDVEMLNKLLPPNVDLELNIFQAFANEMKRLQDIAREVAAPTLIRAEAASERAMELGDKCGDLEKQLDLKRIECDKLRDEIAAMRRKS